MGIDHKKFKEARKKSGLSQIQTANLLGLTQTTVSNIERGFTKSVKHGLYRLLVIYPRLPRNVQQAYIEDN